MVLPLQRQRRLSFFLPPYILATYHYWRCPAPQQRVTVPLTDCARNVNRRTAATRFHRRGTKLVQLTAPGLCVIIQVQACSESYVRLSRLDTVPWNDPPGSVYDCLRCKEF